MKKKLMGLFLVATMTLGMLAGCSDSSSGEGADSVPASDTTETTDAEPEAETEEAADTTSSDEAAHIAVLVKGTEGETWQWMLAGARKAAEDSNGKIVVTEHGAASEADISAQVSILEDIIVSQPDAIVMAPTDSDALNAGIEEAHAAGIKVIIVDTAVNTDAYDVFMANDNYAGGEMMAEQMVKYLNEAGIELKGTVGIVSAVPVQTVYDRDDGFADKLAELAPDINIIRDQYADNDIQKSMDMTLDYITANEDLIGVYGDNGPTGAGIALAIAEAGLEDEVIGVAYDGNTEEVEGIRNGSLKAILVQDLWDWGYTGVNLAYDLIQGETMESFYNTGVTLVDSTNVDNDEIQDIIDPDRRS